MEPKAPQPTVLLERAENEANGKLQLSAELDSGWLGQFGIDSNQENLANLQQLIALDTENLSVDQSTYQQSVVARETFYDALGLPYQPELDTGLKLNARTRYQDRNPTITPLHTTIKTFRIMSKAGIDIVKVVNTLPAAISLNPESVREKMDNLTTLGLDAAKVVNTHPAAIGYAPSKINITAYILMKHGLWEDNEQGSGYKELLNRGEKTNIFITPIESLMSYLQSVKNPTVQGLRKKATVYMKQRGAVNSAVRKDFVKNELLANDRVRKELGYVGVLYAMKEKVADDYDWLFEETPKEIPSSSFTNIST